jgi:hypothetical protein
MRKVYETNISHNFCALVDIFICDNIISLEENNPYNNLCGDLHNQTNLTNIETRWQFINLSAIIFFYFS